MPVKKMELLEGASMHVFSVETQLECKRPEKRVVVSSIGTERSGPLNYLMIIVAMGWLLRSFKVGEREKERKKERERDRDRDR